MGYIAEVACHINGYKSKLFDIQEEYFNNLKRIDIDKIRGQSICLDKHEYIAHGHALCNAFKFIAKKDSIDGKFVVRETKWDYYSHQWLILSNLLTKNLFSWCYLYSGQEEGDIILKSNKIELGETFDYTVMNYFSFDGPHIRPQTTFVYT